MITTGQWQGDAVARPLLSNARSCFGTRVCAAWKIARFVPAVFLLLLTLSAYRASALEPARALTQYQSRHWGPEDGLPCNNVLSVIQTSDGYLWLGTEEGAVRFDGLRTRVFDREHDPGLADNHLSQVLEDRRHQGDLLIADSIGGITLMANGKVQAILPVTAPTHQPGRVMVEDPADHALWVGTMRGLFRVDAMGKVTGPSAAQPSWPSEVINTLCLDAAGGLWVGSAKGIYRRERAAVGTCFDLLPASAGKKVDCLVSAVGGGLWVSSREDGIVRLGEDGRWRPFASLAGCWITTLLEDRNGNLWAGTYGSGLYRFPPGVATTDAAATALTKDHGLVSNVVNDLCEDREGNLWIATQSGLQLLRDTLFTSFGQPEGLASDDVLTVFEDRGGERADQRHRARSGRQQAASRSNERAYRRGERTGVRQHLLGGVSHRGTRQIGTPPAGSKRWQTPALGELAAFVDGP